MARHHRPRVDSHTLLVMREEGACRCRLQRGQVTIGNSRTQHTVHLRALEVDHGVFVVGSHQPTFVEQV